MDKQARSAIKALGIPALAGGLLIAFYEVLLEKIVDFSIGYIGVPESLVYFIYNRGALMWSLGLIVVGTSCIWYSRIQSRRAAVLAEVDILSSATKHMRAAIVRDLGSSIKTGQIYSENARWNLPSLRSSIHAAAQYASRKDRKSVLGLGLSKNEIPTERSAEAVVSDLDYIESFTRRLRAKYQLD